MAAGEVRGSGVLGPEDRRIVRALQLSPRAPFAAVGSALGTSETSVRRRYQRLRADGAIRVVGVVDTGSLGQGRWLLRLRCRPGSATAIADALARRDDVSWVAVAAAGSEVTCWVRSRTDEAREDLLGHRLPRTAAVLELDAAAMLHQFKGGRAHHWAALEGVLTAPEEAALDPAPPFVEHPVVRAEPVALTADDDRLLEVLVTDGRASLVDLAAAAATTPGRAARRLDRLLREGAAHLDLEIGPRALGAPVRANLWLTVHPASVKQVGRALAQEPEIAFAAAVSGPANLHAVAHCRDFGELFDLTSDRIGALPGLRGLEVSPLLRQVKQATTRVVDERLALTGAPQPG